jgi:hypothetical protein
VLLAACSSHGAPATPTGTPYVLPPDAPPYTGPTRPVAGLDAAPEATTVDATRTLAPLPPSPFGTWDGSSVVLFNLETGERIDLGPGRLMPSTFDAQSTRFAWLATPSTSGDYDVRTIDLDTRAQRDYGTGTYVVFANPQTLLIGRSSGATRVDVATGADLGTPPPSTGSFRMHFPGYVLGHVMPTPPTGLGATDWLIVPDDGKPALRFSAIDAVPETGRPNIVALVPAGGTAYDIARIDVAAARATVVARVDFDGLTFPVAVVPQGLAVGDRLCHADGRILFYAFDGGRLTAVTTHVAPAQLSGRSLGVGPGSDFAQAEVDPTTFRYQHVLPAPGVWSQDGRWAAIGPLSPDVPGGCGG